MDGQTDGRTGEGHETNSIGFQMLPFNLSESIEITETIAIVERSFAGVVGVKCPTESVRMRQSFSHSRCRVVAASVVLLLDQIAARSATAREIQRIGLFFRLETFFFVNGVGIDVVGSAVIAACRLINQKTNL